MFGDRGKEKGWMWFGIELGLVKIKGLKEQLGSMEEEGNKNLGGLGVLFRASLKYKDYELDGITQIPSGN